MDISLMTMTRDKLPDNDNHEGDQGKPSSARSHVGTKIAKVLFPLIAAAFCLADAIECILWRVSALPCILLLASAFCFAVASWLFLGFELGLYYDKRAKKLTHSIRDTSDRRAKNRGGWLLLFGGFVLFGSAALTGNMVPLAMFYALLMS